LIFPSLTVKTCMAAKPASTSRERRKVYLGEF
jgi:hypothetical protein